MEVNFYFNTLLKCHYLIVNRDGTAKGGGKLGDGVDYKITTGVLQFKHGETRTIIVEFTNLKICKHVLDLTQMDTILCGWVAILSRVWLHAYFGVEL